MGYKVLFLTLSGVGSGLWLRYTALEGVRKKYSALWLTYFKPGGPRGFVTKVEDMLKISDDSVALAKPLYSLRDGVSTGELNGLRWSLKFKGDAKKYNPVPLLYRILRRKSKYIIVSPNAVFNGSVKLMEEEVTVEGYRGMIGFISGDKYLDHWVWAHCSGFDEDPKGWMDVLVASPDGRRRVLFGLLRYDDKLVHIGRALGVRYAGDLGLGSFKAALKAGGRRINISVQASKEDIVVAKYEDPIDGVRYCHNTEIATATVEVEGVGKLSCYKRSFYEYALTKKLDESIPEVVEI